MYVGQIKEIQELGIDVKNRLENKDKANNQMSFGQSRSLVCA